MPKGYKHLTYEQRCQIEVLLKRNISQKDIAETIGISRSQLCREIKRGANKDGSYNAKIAQRKCMKRQNMSAINTKKVHGFVEKYIVEKLKLPELWIRGVDIYWESMSCVSVH
jgi:transposase, IS30 family